MKSAKYRDTLEELERMVNGAKSFDEVLGIMINTIVDAVHAEAGTLWYYDYCITGKIIPRAVYGGGEIGSFRLEPGEGIAGGVIKDGQPVMISDCQKDSRWAGKVDAKTGFVTKSLICVPLISPGLDSAFGSIQIINKVDGSLFDDEDLNFAIKLSDEFSRLYSERAQDEIVGRANPPEYGFDKALMQDTEESASKLLLENLAKAACIDERAKIKIQNYFIKIYRLLR